MPASKSPRSKKARPAAKVPRKTAVGRTATTTARKAATKAARKTAGRATSKRTPAKKAGAATPAPRKALAEYRRKRDFSQTAEPSGNERSATSRPSRDAKPLRFVIQKHAASHLHFDFRLELDGVMKSWAVPKGPSLDTRVRRLAMQVEDHPISYNSFEGTIPQGQYGGGTVMLWDQGHYLPADGRVESLRSGLKKGRIDIVMLGERLQGAFTMVRSARDGGKPQWLLFKRTDEFANDDVDIVADETTSIVTGRSMEEIAEGNQVWQSNRKASRR